MDIVRFLEREHQIILTEQQKQGVLSEAQNTLLLAVPGSGKTTVLAARLADAVLNRGVPVKRLLTLTFSRETARDMKRRFEGLFGGILPEIPRFSTIHSFCLSVLRSYSHSYHRPMPRLILEENGLRNRILRELYRKYNSEFLTDDSLDTLDNLIGRAKNLLLSREELAGGDWEIDSFPEIFYGYESFKRENGWMDYDDMLTLCLDIFEKCPPIIESVQAAFDEIYVDEAQDTSLAQHRIVSLAARKSRVFMVGDEDQSIYGFRGAYPKALLTFPELYENAEIIKMEQNFRSRGDIIEAANRFIGQNRQRYAKNMFGGQREAGSIEVLHLSDYQEQYNAVATLLRESAGKSVAVLYRNNESALPLIDLFYREGQEYYGKEERFSFFSSGVIRDLTAYVRLADDPCDLEAFSRIYYKLGCSRGIYDAVRERTREYGSVFDAVLSLTSLKPFRRKMIEGYAGDFPNILRHPPAGAIRMIRRKLGYDEYIENRISHPAARSAFRQKLNTACFLAGDETDMFGFFDRLSALQQNIESRRLLTPSSNVTLSTLHSAKGMEFDTVILLDALEDILPAGNPDDRDEYEEEVRLFYVGVTRAKERFVTFRSGKWNGEPVRPTPFLAQLLGKEQPPSAETGNKECPNLEGKRVYHVIFGEGKVLSQKQDIALVEFRSMGEKQLSLPVCLENGILRIKS